MEKRAKSETRFTIRKGGYDKLKKAMREQNLMSVLEGKYWHLSHGPVSNKWWTVQQMSASRSVVPVEAYHPNKENLYGDMKTLAKIKKKRKAYQDTCIYEKAETILNMQKLARNQAKGASCRKATPTGLRSLSLGRLNRTERRYFMHTLRTKWRQYSWHGRQLW